MAKLFAFFVLNEFSCFVSSNAISEAAWPLSSPFWYSRSTVVHLTAFEGFGISGVKGHQPWKNRSQLLAALSAELFTWKLSLKGISFLLPYLSSDTVFFFFQKRTTSPLTEKVSRPQIRSSSEHSLEVPIGSSLITLFRASATPAICWPAARVEDCLINWICF